MKESKQLYLNKIKENNNVSFLNNETLDLNNETSFLIKEGKFNDSKNFKNKEKDNFLLKSNL